jgi:hypothetical protein
MSPNNSGSRTGGAAGGPLASARMTPTLTYQPMPSNHAARQSVASPEDLTELLRLAVVYSAKQLLIAIPPSSRSGPETQFLSDCARGRRTPSTETLSALMALQARGSDKHLFSEQMRAIEIKLAPVQAVDFYDLNEAEQPIDAAADMIQLQAARDKSRTRLQQIAEIGPQVIAAWRRLTDAANHALARAH